MDDPLDLACAHLSTKWLKHELKPLLADLVAGDLSAEGFASHVDALLEERSLKSISQQKNPRSNIVQALKAIDQNHPAIAIIGLSTEQYRNLNELQRGRLAERETKFFSRENAERLVEKASRLLDSAEWSEIAAGLAVLIGRRISEILLSEFEWKSEWSLWFSQMAKKKIDEGETIIEIPTLAPAQQVLDAITRLQAALKIDDLKLESLSPKMAKQSVNARFSAAVAARCEEQFKDLVPPRHDKDNLYTHVFRAVYATIATHWFCPPQVPPHSFKAEIQGHFTISQDGKKLPNFSARANYDDYAICTSTDDPDGRLGIKLGVLTGVQVIDAFRKDEAGQENAIQDATTELTVDPVTPTIPNRVEAMNPVNPTPQKSKTKRPELHADDLAKMTELMAKQGVVGHTAEVFHALLEWVEAGQQQNQQQQVQTVQDVAQTLNWFTKEVESLRAKVQQLEQERELGQSQVSNEAVELLQQENRSLRDQLHQTQARLEGIQKLLGMETKAEIPKAPTGVEEVVREKNQPSDATDERRESDAGEKKREPSVGEKRRDQTEGEKRRDREVTTQKIHQAVDAVVSWNTAQDDGDRQLRISIPTIKGLASAMGANYQPAIQEVLKDREGELEELHRRLMLGSRHNASVKGKDEILKAIAREYLGLENWNEVKY